MSEPPSPPEASPMRPKKGGAPEGPAQGQGQPAQGEGQEEKIQRQLDEALADSFPASDPVSIVTSQEEEDWGAPENGRSPKASK
jgi:hypothetical protein